MTVPEQDLFAHWRTTSETGEFEAALEGLEMSVTMLEAGGLSLAQMTDCYELGLLLSNRCSHLLTETQLRITVLESTLAREEDR